jgi:hypothetical protein
MARGIIPAESSGQTCRIRGDGNLNGLRQSVFDQFPWQRLFSEALNLAAPVPTDKTRPARSLSLARLIAPSILIRSSISPV